MKNISMIIVIIIFVISLDFITENYSKKTVDELSNKLKDLNKCIESENLNIKEMKNKANDILKLWRKKDNILSWYIEHDEIEKVSDKINIFNKQIEIGNYDLARVSIVETEFLLKHMADKQSLSLKNIF